MKQLYSFFLALALCGPARLHAQAVDPTRAALDYVFANLDKSQVPTGRLVEAAMPLAPLLNFDGAVLRDTGRADLDNFRHLYATALSSRLYGTETLPTLPVFNQRVLAASPADTP